MTFTNVAKQARLNKQQKINDGACTADTNGDGYLDIYIGRHRALVPLLAINNKNGTFTIKQLFGFANDRHGAAWGDFDNDGDPDLFISVGLPDNAVDIRDELWRNDGNDIFVNIASTAGVDDNQTRGRTGAWLDYNGDGDLDLLLLVDGNRENAYTIMYRNNGDETFTNVSAEVGLTDDTISSNGGVGLADYDGDGDLDIFMTASFTGSKEPGDLFTEFSLLLQQSDGHIFTDVAQTAGIGQLSLGRGIAWGDYDNDGDLDLYVSRGVREETIMQDGIFKRSTKKIEWLTSNKFGDFEDGLDFATISSGNSVTFSFWANQDSPLPTPDEVFIGASGAHPASIPFTLQAGGPIDPKGQPVFTPGTDEGVFIWQDDTGIWHLRVLKIRHNDVGFVGEDTAGFIATNGKFTSVTPVGMEKSPFDMRNMLFQNNGDGTFAEVGIQAGVAENHDGVSVIWGDIDNDGDLDLFLLNASYDVTDNTITNKPLVLYRNNDNGTFTDVTSLSRLGNELYFVRTTANVGDYNNDGFLDIFIAPDDGPPPNNGKPLVLYQNNKNTNHWLMVKLVGTVSNRDAIGAKVTLEADGKIQFREQNGGFHLIGQNDSRLHFGLGQNTLVDRITVEWPSGLVEEFSNIAVNQIIVLTEGQGTPPTP